MDSHCVVCGNYVPEGRTVCPQCEKGETMDKWTLQEEAFKRGYEKGKADAVVYGRWAFWNCSKCDYETSDLTNYCPNCGAYMVDEEEAELAEKIKTLEEMCERLYREVLGYEAEKMRGEEDG